LPDDRLHLILKALSDPRRYEILKLVGRREKALACEKLRECMDVTPATLSHHMKELETAGLVDAVRDGKFVNYSLCRETLEAFFERLESDLS
jgi:ArsR family transcriptional regulator